MKNSCFRYSYPSIPGYGLVLGAVRLEIFQVMYFLDKEVLVPVDLAWQKWDLACVTKGNGDKMGIKLNQHVSDLNITG